MNKELYTANRWTCAPVVEPAMIKSVGLTEEEKVQVAKWREKILKKIEEEHKRD